MSLYAHLSSARETRRLRNALRWLAFVWLSMLSFLCWGVQQQNLVLAYQGDAAPLQFTDERGQAAGLLVDLWRAWAEQTGIALRFVEASSPGQGKELVELGIADAHTGLQANGGAESLAYTDPLFELDYFSYTNKSILELRGLGDLMGFRIGVVAGAGDGYLRSSLPGASLAVFDRPTDLFRAADEGKLKVFVSSPLFLQEYFRREGVSPLFDYDASRPLFARAYRVAVAKQNHALKEAIETGFARLEPQRRIAIEEHWLGSAGANSAVLTIAGSRALPPFTMLTRNGEPAGVGVELWKLWSRKTGRPVQFRLTDMSRSLANLKDGRADVHAGLFRSEERAQWLSFSEPYLRFPVTLYYPYADGQQRTLASFSAARVGFLGPPPRALLASVFKQAVASSYESIEQMIKAVEQGEIDAFIADRPSTEAVLVRLGLRGDFHALDRDLFQVDLRAALPKDHDDLLAQINAGFDAMSRAEMEAIIARWLGKSADFGVYLPRTDSIRFSPEEQDWLKAHPVVRIGIDPKFAPYEFLGENGRAEGISADFLAVLGTKLGLSFELVPTGSWNETLEQARGAEIDLLPLLNRTPEREQFLRFTDAYFVSQRVIITRGRRPDLVRERDLAGKTIVLPRGYSVGEHLKERYPTANIVESNEIATALQRVSEGAADATILSIGVAAYWLERSQISNLRIAAPFGRPSTLAMGVRADWPQLVSILQKGLDSIGADERLRIRRRWIGLADADTYRDGLGLTTEELDWLNRHPVVNVGADAHWPPIEFVDQVGVYRGITADYLSYLGRTLGIRFQPKADLPWAQTLELTRKRELDAVAAVSRSEEREQYLAFTHPYFSAPHALYTRRDTAVPTRLEQLNNRTVAVEKDFYLHEQLSVGYPNIKLLLVTNTGEALQALSRGDADAYIGNPAVADWLIEQNQWKDLVAGSNAVELGKSELRLGLRKDWSLLASIINKALAAMPPEDHRRIRRRWLTDGDNRTLPIPDLREDERRWLAEHRQIRIGLDAGFAPYSFLDSDGRFIGIVPELLPLLEEMLGVEFVSAGNLSWTQILEGARSRDLDVIATAVRTPEREQFLAFSDIYIETPRVIMTRNEVQDIRTPEDLNGRIVALVRGYSTSDRVLREQPGVKPLLVETAAVALTAVAVGHADAYVGVLGISTYLASKQGIGNLRVSSPYGDPEAGQRFGIRSDWPELAGILNKALNAIPEKTKLKILRDWLPTEPDSPSLKHCP